MKIAEETIPFDRPNQPMKMKRELSLNHHYRATRIITRGAVTWKVVLFLQANRVLKLGLPIAFTRLSVATPSMTKEVLRQRIMEMGEEPPAEWTRTQLVQELKDETSPGQKIQNQLLVEMNRASKKKADLQKYIQNSRSPATRQWLAYRPWDIKRQDGLWQTRADCGRTHLQASCSDR